MMHKEKISVIIPYFSASRTIARAVRSVLMQSVPPAEIIVVDDGSPDDVAAVLKEFGSDVTLIRKSNGGAASARNAGIEQARGEWIAFLDADDYWEPTKLERQLTFSLGVGLVGSRWFTETPGEARFTADVSCPSLFGKMFSARGSDAFDVAMNLWTGVVLVRRSVVGGQRFDPGLETAEDRDFWIRLAASTPIYLVPEPLATYVQYKHSLSNSDTDRDCRSMLKVVRSNARLLGRKKCREQEAIVYRRWAGCHLARRHPRLAIVPAARRLAMQPASPQAWWIMAKSLGQSLLSKSLL